jgi:hypothetical protein
VNNLFQFNLSSSNITLLMTLIKPTHHLSFIKWGIIQMLGKFASRITNPDRPSNELDVNTWCLYRRTNPIELDIDSEESTWETSRAHSKKYADITLTLDNGTTNIPVQTLNLNDLLCLKIGREYVELCRKSTGWAVCTVTEMTSWDHWLVSGSIST